MGDDGGAGLVGGDAMNLTVPCTINAGSGAVWSGGGGAGGTRTALIDSLTFGLIKQINTFEGNGGSGGAGYVTSLGGDRGFVTHSGFNALRTFEVISVDGLDSGIGGPSTLAGVSGGDFGEQGDTPASDPSLPGVGGVGGIAGLAIKTNGNAVTITSGDNPINIKGAIV